MKKNTIVLLVSLLFLLNYGFTQMTIGGKLEVISNDVIAKSGSANLNSLIKPTTGFSIGAFANYKLNSSWSMQSELLYRRTGFQLSEGTSFSIGNFDIPIGATVEVSLNYLSMPLLLKYSHDLGTAQAYALAGPSVNYAMNGKVETTANSFIDFSISETDLNLGGSAYNRWALGGVLGAGVTWPLDNGISLSGEVRYTTDFSSMVEVPVIEARVRNQGWSIGVGVGKRI